MSISTDGSTAASRPESTDVPPPLLEVGRISKAHGLRGELVVRLTTDRIERVDPGARLFAVVSPSQQGWLKVRTSRPHQTRFVVAFEGIADRTGAERWHGAVLRAEPIDDPDATWVHELIGSSVVTVDGVECGDVESVIDNPASDLLSLADGRLVPLVFVTEGPVVRDDRRVVVIDPPEGLLDL